MIPDTSQWWLDAAYDYIDDIPARGVAWEYLRRNTHYQQDYAETLVQADDARRVAEALPRRWELRFRGPPKPNLAGTARLLDAPFR